MKRFALHLLLTALAAVLLFAPTVDAQHLRYKTKSKMKVESLGFLGSLLDSEVKEEVSIYGDYKRVDRKDASTITNLETREFIHLDHKEKEYSRVSFDDMMAMWEQTTADAGEKMDEYQSEMESEQEAAEYTVEFDLRVEETGKTRKYEGHELIQRVLIIETLFEPKDPEAADTMPSTSLFVVNDLWQADELEEMAVNDEFNRRMGEALQQEFDQENMSMVISALLKTDPRVGEAMDKVKEELKNVSGTTLISTMHLVTVPPDQELDLPLALGEKEEEKSGGGGFGSFLKKAVESQGVDMGGGEEGGEEKPKTQSTFFSIESKTEDISDKSRKMDYYMAPGNYAEVEFEMPKVFDAGG